MNNLFNADDPTIGLFFDSVFYLVACPSSFEPNTLMIFKNYLSKRVIFFSVIPLLIGIAFECLFALRWDEFSRISWDNSPFLAQTYFSWDKVKPHYPVMSILYTTRIMNFTLNLDIAFFAISKLGTWRPNMLTIAVVHDLYLKQATAS